MRKALSKITTGPKLAQWFDRQKRVLPWRDDPSVYRVWISEIMLQQTQVVTVIPYFEKFIARFPDVTTLARAPESEVLLYWAGLGYYSRARNIHRTAQLIEQQKRFPMTHAEWLEMPGVGPYTAGAIVSIALDQPSPILDGNVERVLSRFYALSRTNGGLRGSLGDAQYKRELWRLADLWVKAGHAQSIAPRCLNQAIMELGAMVCQPKQPRCKLCPLQSECKAFAIDQVEKYPEKKQRAPWIQVEERRVALFDRKGRVQVVRVPDGQWRAGLWDLPTEYEPVSNFKKIGSVVTEHVVTRHQIKRTTQIFKIIRTAKTGGRLKALDDQGVRWIDPLTPEVATGSALKKSLQRIVERFPEVLPKR